MTELTHGSSQGLETVEPVSAPVNISEQPQNTGLSPTNEKSFSQIEVNRIVKDAKKDAVDTYRRLQVEQPDYFARKYGEQAAQGVQQNPHNANAQTQPQQHPINASLDDVRRTAAEEAQRYMDSMKAEEQRKAQQQMDERIVADFFTKLNTEKDSYPDLDKKMSNLDLSRMANTVWIAKDLDHKSLKSLFQHLSDNPHKAMQIEQLTMWNPKGAQHELSKMVESLKLNEEAANLKIANAPLRLSKPGNSGLGSGGDMTVAQARAKYKG